MFFVCLENAFKTVIFLIGVVLRYFLYLSSIFFWQGKYINFKDFEGQQSWKIIGTWERRSHKTTPPLSSSYPPPITKGPQKDLFRENLP